MRRLLLLSTFILVIGNAKAQKSIDKTDSLRLSIVNELHQKQIKDFFFLIKISPSSLLIIESDSLTSRKVHFTDFTGYVFWNENLKTYLQKFDSFGKFNMIEIPNFKGFELATQKLNIIKSENILPYMIMEKGKETVMFSPNEYQYSLHFNFGVVAFEKHFRADVLIKNDYINRPDMENRSYTKNANLQVIKLYKLCTAAILNIETKKLHRI